MTPSGIEAATFQLVAQCLNQLLHLVPPSSILRIHKQSAALYNTCYTGGASSQELPTPWLLYYWVFLIPVFDNSLYSFPLLSVDHLTFVQSYVNSISTIFNTDFRI